MDAAAVVLTTAPTAMQPSPKIGGALGDRTSKQDGMTATESNTIAFSSWEVKPPRCCQTFCLALRCSTVDLTRSYIYIRSNASLELNDTNGIKSCCTCCGVEAQDNVSVMYYDRDPLAEDCKVAPFPWCCCCYTDVPKIEVLDNGCMCCCIKIDPCCLEKQAVIMPFEKMPPPCCCCSNRTSDCDNCFGLCGPPTGNPKVHLPFSPQPKDAVAFVAATQLAMNTVRTLAKGAPDSAEMER